MKILDLYMLKLLKMCLYFKKFLIKSFYLFILQTLRV